MQMGPAADAVTVTVIGSLGVITLAAYTVPTTWLASTSSTRAAHAWRGQWPQGGSVEVGGFLVATVILSALPTAVAMWE